MDSATYETEQLIAKMEYRLNREYSQAEKEIEEKLNKHFERYKEKDERQRQKVERGQLSEKDYQEWRKSQLLAGKRWENQKAVISQDLYNVNRIATSIVNGYMPEVYAIGHNFATYQMETAAGIDTGYTLYNREAVEKMLRENKALLPPPRDINKFKDGLWNRSMLQSVMIQGILQGESMTVLAKRLAKKTGDSNKKSAMRNARTMSASALNGGRYDAAKRLKGMGVDVKLQWRATFDTRTRDTHRQMDGEVREVGEEFSNGLLFPVDMEKFSHGGLMKVSEFNHLCRETYNCRCAIRSLVKGLEPQAIKYRVGEVKGLSYEEWKKGRNKPRMMPKAQPKHKPAVKATTQAKQGAEKLTSKIQGANLPKYTPKNTLSEIRDYLQNTLGIGTLNMNDTNTSTVALNIVADEITKFYNVFGNLHDKGVLNDIFIREGRVSYVAAYSPPANMLLFRKKSMKLKNPLKSWGKEAAEQHGYGFWSNGAPEQTIRHELGHSIHKSIYDSLDSINLQKTKDIEDLWQDTVNKVGITKWVNNDKPETMALLKKSSQYLSYYGLKDSHEFVAECVAEYMGGNPREVAKKCVEIILRG